MDTSENVYHDLVADLDQFGLILCSLLKEVLTSAGIQVHSIDYRVKDYQSALKKLSNKQDKYSSASELTDLLGVRIITYFSDDVDRVSKAIVKDFDIDKDNSIDKRKMLGADQFGYLSLHYVASLAENRSDLIEYKRFAKIKFELQIRSILQHAWAEIEHDIGYKADGAVPDKFKRRFFRLAGSLELADEEFQRLRDEASRYKKTVRDVMKKSPKLLPIDQDTIVTALKNEEALIDLDNAIAKVGGRALKKDVDPNYAASEVLRLKVLGVSNIDQLIKYSKKYRKHIEKFAEYWVGNKESLSKSGKSSGNNFSRGIGLFYLGYILVAQKQESELVNWGHGILGREGDLIDRVKETFEKVEKEVGPLPNIDN